MPTYGNNPNPGQVRRRVWRVECENPLKATSCAIFHEQDAIRLEDLSEEVLRNCGTPLTKEPTDPAEVVELRDPSTDKVIGSTTIGAIYASIYSLARHVQGERDAAQAGG